MPSHDNTDLNFGPQVVLLHYTNKQLSLHLFQDIIDQVCTQESLQIVPIVRPFFALCNPKTGMPLCPYHVMTPEDATKQYQLRVFVNTCENSYQFLRMSKVAYGYYYRQVRPN